MSATVNIVPTAALTASSSSVGSGGTTTLTWSSTDSTSCTASGAWSGTLPPSGTQTSAALTDTSSFSLTCAGAGGTSAAAQANVTVITAPTAALSLYPTVVAPGGTSVLTWSSLNSTACTASGGWTGAVATSGTQNTAALNAGTTYSLTCSGPNGISSVATAAVAVSTTAMSVSPSISTLTLTGAQQFTAVVPGGGSATWMVDNVPGGNSTVGQISGTGLYTAGTGAGAHTVVVTSVANTGQSASATAAVTDLPGVFTYHNNVSRDGANMQEYALTTGNVTAAHFGKLATCKADGAIYGQPLWVANVVVAGAKHNVVYVATQHDGLFAFDADAVPCATLWSVNLIDAAHGGQTNEAPVPSALIGLSFGDIQPEVGVTSTPVIDPAAGILYVLTKSYVPTPTAYYQRLHAIDLTSGVEKAGSPVAIAATYPGTGDGGTTVAFSAHQELQRSGLAFVNGVVYMAWSSHEDASPFYGWMMGYQYDGTTLSQKYVLNVAPNMRKAGIWMSGAAPASDASNNLYVITGNGTFDASSATTPRNDYGDSLLQLAPALTVSQYFTPSDQDADDLGDHDFGAGGAAVLADLPAGNTITRVIIGGGKDQVLYVLNRDLLGGFGDAVSVQKITLAGRIFSTGAFWNNSFYLAGLAAPLQAFKLNPSTVQFALGSSSSHSFGFPGTTPSISASSPTQNGIVWSLDTNKYCTHQSSGCAPAVLFAHDATNVAKELWNSSASGTDAAGNAVKFAVPTVANGKVYVGTRGNNAGGSETSTTVPGELDIYGLK